MIHALIVLLLQACVGIITSNWWIGAAFALVYLGREHAQAEYRWIEHHGSGKRANMPWWGGFDPKVWNVKSMLDWSAPLLTGLTLAITIPRSA